MNGAPGDRLRDDVTARLAEELGDPQLAARLGPQLFDAMLTWTPPTVPVDAMDTIVAYGFGNRLAADGTPEPGPMNAQLAAVVQTLAAERPGIPVYAQWEIARVLEQEHGRRDVVAIEPTVEPDGATVYLSTRGVADQIVATAGVDALGVVGVVAWRDHQRRCVETSRSAGMLAAGAPEGIAMPCVYDPESGQPWTRDRATYVVHDVLGRLVAIASR